MPKQCVLWLTGSRMVLLPILVTSATRKALFIYEHTQTTIDTTINKAYTVFLCKMNVANFRTFYCTSKS